MRVALAVLLAIGVVGTAAAVLLHTSDEGSTRTAPAKLTYGQLAQIAERVDRDREVLADQGVLLETAGVGDGCTFVSLLNPTAPNIAYMQRRYSNLCVEKRPLGPLDGCVTGRGLVRRGPVIVPDVRDPGLAEASRRLVAAGLSFTTGCIGDARVDEWVPSNPADRLVRVTSQCPRPGQPGPPPRRGCASSRRALAGFVQLRHGRGRELH
jgi:photosystem II stability/assembly factor-like uncharacterized protein